MKCEELLAMLSEYVDGAADPAICQEFEQHMAGCNPCQVVVDNLRKTITLYKGGKVYELPVEFRRRLHAALRQRWAGTHPAGDHARDDCVSESARLLESELGLKQPAGAAPILPGNPCP